MVVFPFKNYLYYYIFYFSICDIPFSHFITDSMKNRKDQKGKTRVRKEHKGDRKDVHQGWGKKYTHTHARTHARTHHTHTHTHTHTHQMFRFLLHFLFLLMKFIERFECLIPHLFEIICSHWLLTFKLLP